MRRGIAGKHAGNDAIPFRESPDVFVLSGVVPVPLAIFQLHGQQFRQKSLAGGFRSFRQECLDARSVSLHQLPIEPVTKVIDFGQLLIAE